MYIALCAHEPVRCCRNSGRIRRKMSEGRWRDDASAVHTMRPAKITPHGAPKNAEKHNAQKSFDQDNGCGGSGQYDADSEDALRPSPMLGCLSPCMNARAHRQTRAHPNTSGLGTTNKITVCIFRQVQWRTTKCIAQGARTRGPAEARSGRAWGVPPSQMSRSLLRCSILLSRGPVLA